MASHNKKKLPQEGTSATGESLTEPSCSVCPSYSGGGEHDRFKDYTSGPKNDVKKTLESVTDYINSQSKPRSMKGSSESDSGSNTESFQVLEIPQEVEESPVISSPGQEIPSTMDQIETMISARLEQLALQGKPLSEQQILMLNDADKEILELQAICQAWVAGTKDPVEVDQKLFDKWFRKEMNQIRKTMSQVRKDSIEESCILHNAPSVSKQASAKGHPPRISSSCAVMGSDKPSVDPGSKPPWWSEEIVQLREVHMKSRRQYTRYRRKRKDKDEAKEAELYRTYRNNQVALQIAIASAKARIEGG